jgi:heme/copper-type cytochrome/quinol oxidase subunit 2
MLRRYVDYCGIKSVIFQVLTIVWFVFCAIVLALFIFAGTRNVHIYYVDFAGYVAQSLICAGTPCVIVGVPLLIAAIATLKR